MAFESDNSDRRSPAIERPASPVTRPRLGVFELALQLWRAKWIMLLTALPLMAVGLFVVMQLPEEYQAVSRVQVSIGREYVYEPLIGDAGKGAVLESESVVRAEAEKLYSPVIMRAVRDKLGLSQIYPEMAEEAAEAETIEDREAISESALQAMQAAFAANLTAKSPVIHVTFTHENPKTAAEVTNAIVDEYLLYRTGLIASSSTEPFERQRDEFIQNLTQTEDAIRDFLLENRIGDYETERQSLSERYATISNELVQVEASQREAQARLTVLRREISQLEPEMELSVDTSGDEQLLQLQIEREQLLGRYRPESQPVREIDARIANLRQLLQSSEGGVRRRGPNPTYLDLESRISVQRAELEALRSRAAELRRQMERVEVRQMELINLLPTYQRLVREQQVLETSVQSLAEREQTQRASNRLATDQTNSVTVLDRAYPPSEGDSMKLIGALATAVFAGFTALMIGLGWALTRKGFATRNSVERTLGLPVIGLAPQQKRRRA